VIYARELGAALGRRLREDPRTVLLGEDIADPYGGAFKVTRGLSSEFPDRVKTTPVSEGAIAGVAAGLAMGGYRPIVEIMFGDFLSLCFDQVVNHIAKYEAMYAGAVSCPVVIRAPSGGHRGYGPTHSQCLEKHFLGAAHLEVVAASLRHDPYEAFDCFARGRAPVLFVEHKLLYPLPLDVPSAGRAGDLIAETLGSGGRLPTIALSMVPREDCAVTLLAYGYEAHLAEGVMTKLAVEDEIFAELLIPAYLSPIDWAPIERSVRSTKRLITIEEGTAGWSWGSEIAAGLPKRVSMARPVEVLASERTVIPGARPKEKAMLVGVERIERAIREVVA
jgi:pyruvate/2-oxoglutarate/acetoin dehydrogenase E1 component